MTLRMRIDTEKELYTTLISVYALTLTNPEDVKEHFYDNLRRVLTKIPSNDKILLLGDFNARVGRNADAWQQVIGQHGIGNQNSNGLLLLTLCSEFQLTITNTLFQMSNQYKGTWQHPRSKTWHMIDFVITRQKDRSDIKITRAHRGTECWSDHRLVRSKVKFSLPSIKCRSKRSLPQKVNVSLLKDPAKVKEL